jgi:uncharacterized circularly permuted ATP-grasp superfamily protein
VLDVSAPILSRDEIKQVVREVFDEHHEFVGTPVATVDQREEVRKDAMWVRAMRLRMDAAAGKIGYLVLTAIVLALIAVFTAGLKIKVGQ